MVSAARNRAGRGEQKQGLSDGPWWRQQREMLPCNMGIMSLFSLTQAVGKETPSDVWLSWLCFLAAALYAASRGEKMKKKREDERREVYRLAGRQLKAHKCPRFGTVGHQVQKMGHVWVVIRVQVPG